MKKIGVLAVALAMAFLLVGVASAEMYVEAYLGAAAASDFGQKFTATSIDPFLGIVQTARLKFNGHSDITPIGGVKLGTWFVPEGFAGLNYPAWMRYLGFYTDFSYQRMILTNQKVSGSIFFNNVFIEGLGGGSQSVIQAQGMVATWAFMFAGRYGFFQDSEVPFGRLQPYIAVGPAVMFSSMKPKLNAFGITSQSLQVATSPGTEGSVNIALAVDAGIRYMALKNVSIDLSFKYRYAAPSYNFSGQDASFGASFAPVHFKLEPTYNLFSGQLGVAYHF